MLKLRLQRRGKRNYATYRVVVADHRAPIKGKFVADVGSYNPHTDEFKVREEIVKDWLAKGVQPSATVNNLLINAGIVQGDKMTSWRPKVRPTPEATDGKEDAKKEEPEAKKDEEKPEKADPEKPVDADLGAGDKKPE